MTSETKRNISQSFEHMRMKLYFYENIPLSNKVSHIEEEYKIADQVIDIYVELKNGTKIGIEIQHSKISEARLLERTFNYSKQGIYVLWILNGNSFNRKPQNQDGIRISKLETQLHKLYDGRVYYVNVEHEGLLSNVYSLSYVPYFKLKDIVYKKKAKSTRSVCCQQIKNLRLKCISNKYLLARFEDKNIKSCCEEEIYTYLKKYCKETYKHRGNKINNQVVIPVIEIISSLREKYGFYVVYDVLKSSKTKESKIQIARMGFMKDSKDNIRECIKVYLNDYIRLNS